jgi:glucuronate isomerase
MKRSCFGMPRVSVRCPEWQPTGGFVRPDRAREWQPVDKTRLLWSDEAVPENLTVGYDRLFPADPATRAVARRLYDAVSDLPIISPHGHVDPRTIDGTLPLGDPASLFVTPDHYVTRLLHANGSPLDRLRGARGEEIPPAREIWRRFCTDWDVFDGTASGYWIAAELSGVFGVTERPCASNADRLFDALTARLAEPAFHPKALLQAFNIELLATTDDPLDDLTIHDAIAADPSVATRVIPTFRPDAYLDPSQPTWEERVASLAQWSGSAAGDYDGYISALEARRRYFIAKGAVSADHGVLSPLTVKLDRAEAAGLYERALRGMATDREIDIFRAHMLYEMARMSVADGLVMTVHAGVLRNHHTPTFNRFGADAGCDLPIPTTFVEGLRAVLDDFGTVDDFHLVLFTVDETTWSRELAPLAGFYPSVFIGAPWWFLDAPDAMLRFRSAVTETAGFTRVSGFIDDTRALCSIPARHDASRRVDAAFLGRLVVEGRLTEDRARCIAIDSVDSLPRRVFKL